MAGEPPGWQVDDWRAPGGRRPVQEFINGLSKLAKAKVLAALTALEEYGNQLQMPRSRALGGGLHELRIPHPEGPFRVVYCYQPGRKIVLLHAFIKRTEETPRSDLELAEARKPAG